MNVIRLIAGSGRSGTTWIQDALAAANGLRPVFEPLHPYLSDTGARYAHRALSAEEEHPELRQFLIAACAGRGLRLWTQYRQQVRWLFPPPSQFWTLRDAGRTKRHWAKFLKEFARLTRRGFYGEPLVKCIRANLMLPWVVRHLDCRAVLIVRHPGAVVESELRGRWNADFALDRFRRDSRLHELTGGRYRALLARKLTHVQALTARWVIENQWVIETASANGIPVIYYEHLRSHATTEWQRLCASLGVSSVPDTDTLTRPSQQSGPGRKSVPLTQSSTPRWMRGLTSEQMALVRGILDDVMFRIYSLEDPNPLAAPATASSIENAMAIR